MAASDNQDNIINYAGDFRVKVVNILSYRKAEGSESISCQSNTQTMT